jgi:hypothetical protein
MHVFTREISCAQNRMRVKSAPLFSCSIASSNKQRSNAELNADSQSFRWIAITTHQSGDLVASAKTSSASYRFLNAGFAPAFLRTRRLRARRAEFISVSGRRTDRSAPRSDMRHKRTSGVVAATVQPRAPMNSPLRPAPAGNPGFHLNH